MAFDALVDYSRKRIGSILNRTERPVDRGLGFAGSDPSGQVYNEATFRHFLALERKRAERSGRSLLLMLISLKSGAAAEGRITPALAARLFTSMTACVREVDFIGWYREEQVVGAVLAQGRDVPGADIQRVIVERVTTALRRKLSARVADGLQVRVLHVRRRQ